MKSCLVVVALLVFLLPLPNYIPNFALHYSPARRPVKAPCKCRMRTRNGMDRMDFGPGFGRRVRRFAGGHSRLQYVMQQSGRCDHSTRWQPILCTFMFSGSKQNQAKTRSPDSFLEKSFLVTIQDAKSPKMHVFTLICGIVICAQKRKLPSIAL